MDEFDDIGLFDDEPGANKAPPARPVSNQPRSTGQRKRKKQSKNKQKPEVSSVQVVDPDKRGEGIKVYIVYKVLTIFTNDENFKVERRYSDFKWLHTSLSAKIKGVIIPPIPNKDFLGRFLSPDFVEKRRRGLEFFLREVSRHDLLRESEEFRLFLTADIPSLRLAMVSEADDNTTWLASKFTDLRDYYLAPTSDRAPTEDDAKCEKIAEYANRLLKIVTALDTQVQALMKSSKEASRAWFELGLSMTTLGGFQRQHGYQRIGEALTYLGKHADNTANLVSEKIDVQETRQWSEPVERYKKLVIAIQDMMQGRKELLLTLKREEGNLFNLKAKAKTASGDQLKAVQTEISMSEQRVACLEGNLKKVTKRLFEEFETFKNTKAEELKTLIIEFGQIQADHHARMATDWNNVLQCMQNESYPVEVQRDQADMDFVDFAEV